MKVPGKSGDVSSIRVTRQNTSPTNQYSNIFEAVSKGDLDAVKNFIEVKKVDVNSFIPGSRETIFMKAAQLGNLDLLKYLFSGGAKINAIDRNGYNALLWAVDSNNEETNVIRYLLNNGADFKVKDKKNGYTAAHWAAHHGRLDVLQSLQEKGAPLNENTTSNRPIEETPLTMGAVRGHLHVVSYLLDKKFATYNGDIYSAVATGYAGLLLYFIEKQGPRALTSKNNKGQTVLHVAAANGRLQLVKYLVDERHVDIAIQDSENHTAAQLAAQKGKLDVLKYFVNEKNVSVDNAATIRPENSFINLASRGGHMNVVRFLIEEKGVKYDGGVFTGVSTGNLGLLKYFLDEKMIPVESKDDNGDSLLAIAAFHGQRNIVEYLVDQKRADLKTQNISGDDPVKKAASNGKLDVIKYLVDVKKASFNAKNNNNDTALASAADFGHLNVVMYLINEKKANFNEKDNYGYTPLTWAGKSGRLEVVKYLIEKKSADPKDTDKWGNNLAQIVVTYGKLEVLKYLLEVRKLDSDQRDKYGNTLFKTAAQNGHLHVVQYLAQQKGADVQGKNYNGDTPVHSAAYYGHLDVLMYLLEERKADINVKTNLGNTPLHLVATHDGLIVIRYLVDGRNADINLKNDAGATPLMEAAASDQLDVVKYFVEEKRMSITDTNNEGDTPLKVAQKKNRTNVVEYLQSMSVSRRRRHARHIISSDYISAEGVRSSITPRLGIGLALNEHAVGSSTGRGSTPYSSVTPQKYENRVLLSTPNFSLNEFLSLADVAVRRLSNRKHNQPIHDSLLSRHDILEDRINSIEGDVTAAIRTAYNEFDE